MDLTADDIAGVVDLFGGLTRAELGKALAELAFKRGEEHDPGAFGDGIDGAVQSFHLVAVGPDAAGVTADGDLLVAGPVAFPTLPDGAADLPHILDVDERAIDRETVATAAERRFREAASEAVEADDADRIEALLDVSYELEAWGDLTLEAARDRLDDARG